MGNNSVKVSSGQIGGADVSLFSSYNLSSTGWNGGETSVNITVAEPLAAAIGAAGAWNDTQFKPTDFTIIGGENKILGVSLSGDIIWSRDNGLVFSGGAGVVEKGTIELTMPSWHLSTWRFGHSSEVDTGTGFGYGFMGMSIAVSVTVHSIATTLSWDCGNQPHPHPQSHNKKCSHFWPHFRSVLLDGGSF